MRARQLFSGIAALAVTAVAVVGVPALLLATVGNPWPGRTAIDLHDQTAIVTGVLAMLAWLLWARFVLALAIEAVRQIRRHRHSPASAGPPLIAIPSRVEGSFGALAAGLVAAILALLPTAVSVTPAAAGGPLPVRHAPPAITATAPAPAEVPVAPAGAATAATTVVVARGDTLYGIARAQLGDASRWREIFELNRDRPQPDGDRLSSPSLIRPGWLLLLPASAPPATTERVHVVARGDSYWEIATDDLAVSNGRHPTPGDVLAYTQRLMGDNAPRLGHQDPALLLPGEQVRLAATPAPPAVDEPPAAPIAPADPQPQSAPPVTAVDAPEPLPPPTSPSAEPSVPTTATTTTTTTAVPAVAPAGEQESSPSGWPRGLGAAGLLAAGVGGLVLSRRRAAMRAARGGARLRTPTERQELTERALAVPAGVQATARLDVALRAAAVDLVAQRARVLAVTMAVDGAVRLVTDRPCTPSTAPWRIDLESGSWVLPGAVELAELTDAARQAPIVSPALVALGRTNAGELYVDLEALGLLCVDAGAAGAAVARHLAATLAVSPFAGGVRLATVGLDEIEALDVAAVEAGDDPTEGFARAVGWASSTAAATSADGSTFAMRVHSDGETWDPAVLISAGADIDAALAVAIVGHAGGGGRGLAVVVDRPIDGARWVLRATGTRMVLEPLGIEVEVTGLELDDVDAVAELIAAAGEPAVEQPIPLAQHRPDGAPYTEPPWSLLVQTLGRVAVQTADGDTVGFERSKALELVVWLSVHRDRPTRALARTALWALDVRDTTFANVVSDARRAMAKAVPPPEGEEWIGRNVTDQLPLNPLVALDAELIEARTKFARGRSAHDVIEVLRPALELVSGMPFAGTSFQWIDSPVVASDLTLTVVEAASELGAAYLAIGDIEAVFWTTGQGLKALAGHEELISLRMRAYAERGDLAGVRSEWAAYERALHADPVDGAEPSQKLVALRRRLLAPSQGERAS